MVLIDVVYELLRRKLLNSYCLPGCLPNLCTMQVALLTYGINQASCILEKSMAHYLLTETGSVVLPQDL